MNMGMNEIRNEKKIIEFDMQTQIKQIEILVKHRV